MKYILRTLGVLVLGAILVGCSSGFEGSRLESQAVSLTGLKWLTDSKKTFTAPPPNTPGNYNCVTTEFDIPPQGFRAQGSTGGLTYAAFAGHATSGTVGLSLKNNLLGSYNPTQTTEILIVDDFGASSSPAYKLPSDIFSSSATSTTLEESIRHGKTTHGAVVIRHTNDALLGSGLYSVLSQTNNGSQTVYQDAQKKSTTLTVTAVNTRLASQAIIGNTTRAKITTGDLDRILYDTLKNAPRSMVVNMSFVLTPCQVYEDFVVSGAATLEQYVERLVVANGRTSNNNGLVDTATEFEFVNAIIESTNLSNDPLKKLIDLFAIKHIFIGASGNYGLPTAMYPAKWAGVVNVTGSTFDNQSARATTLFNAGEVMSVGSLFKLNPPSSSGKALYYFGTSYSAPSVSVYSALDLAGKQHCTDSQTYKSELALDTVTMTDSRLESAVPTRCGAN
jgi:hypothetical protein